MQRQIKGALAATVALVVMLGGGNSLAKWVDQETLSGAKVTAGTLSLGACVQRRRERVVRESLRPRPQPKRLYRNCRYRFVQTAGRLRLRLLLLFTGLSYWPSVASIGNRGTHHLPAAPCQLLSTAFRTYVTTQSNVELYNSTLTPKIRSDLTSAQNAQDVLVTVAFSILPNDPLSAGGTLNMAGLSLVTQQLAPI